MNIGTQRSWEVSVAARRYWPACSHIIPPFNLPNPNDLNPSSSYGRATTTACHRLHFSQVAGLLLEKSTTYLERPDSERRIREIPGGVRPIVILRDPVERAISNWKFSTENGLEDLPARLAFSEKSELRPFPKAMSSSPFHYVRRSMYSTLLEPWIQSRGANGMSFLLFESLTAEPEETITRLQAELELEIHRPASMAGVDASHQVETD